LFIHTLEEFVLLNS